MKKKIILILIIVAVLLTGSILLYTQYMERQREIEYWNTHITIEGVDYPLEVQQLTLTQDPFASMDILTQLAQLKELDLRNSSLSISDYERIQKALPNCNILWNVPFQGNPFPLDTTTLTIEAIAEEDIQILSYFASLTSIDATNCEDYPALMALKEAYPQVALTYTVTLMGQEYPQDTTELILENADLAQLEAVLPYLPELHHIRFTGVTPESEEIYRLMVLYPQICFEWDLVVCGKETVNTVTLLDLNGIYMRDTSEVESVLKYFPKLERVEMCDTGIPSDKMDALSQKFPDIRFVWTIKIRNGKLRTDAVAFIPYKIGYDIDKPLFDYDLTELKYCIDLVCLDLGHMKIWDVSFLEYMPKMKYLVLVDMPCSDFSALENLTELIYLELFNVRFTQHELLLNMTKLEDLNLGFTPTYNIDVLQQMTWLKRLWIPANKIPTDQYPVLSAALPDTKIVFQARHSTDLNWRDSQNYRDMRDLLGMHYMK